MDKTIQNDHTIPSFTLMLKKVNDFRKLEEQLSKNQNDPIIIEKFENAKKDCDNYWKAIKKAELVCVI